jgi:cation diffusion facilitator CzcD-associated flavoprotein CzcO
MQETNLLIIGAGPFGLSLAAYAQYLNIDHQILGEPMGFWKDNMPAGMYLRSASDWHLDPVNEHTMERYIGSLGKTPADVEPLALDFYLDYCQWFMDQKSIRPRDVRVVRLEKKDGVFLADLEQGGKIKAGRVAIALGFKYFCNIPKSLSAMIPAGRWGHTCDEVDLKKMEGRRCLIVGGRQSAFEWAALLREAGATSVHIVHRHDTPAFSEADWSWVPPLVDGMADNPAWFRRLSEEEKKEVDFRLWAEGRLKVEPWLADRVLGKEVQVLPNTELAACKEQADGSLKATLSNGAVIDVDHIILATGYRVDVSKIPFLVNSSLLSEISTERGYPVLDEHMQTTVPGLFMTSMAAVQDFGPFFAFTVSVRASARIIGAGLEPEVV